MSGMTSGDVEVAAREGSGDQEGAGFDAIGDDAVLRALQFAHTFYADGGRASAFDFCSHFIEQVGEVGDFGLASGILQNGFAFGQSGGHEQVFGSGDGDFVKDDFGAAKASGRGFDVAVLLRDFCSEKFEAFDVEIDWTLSNGAATGERDAGPPAAGD